MIDTSLSQSSSRQPSLGISAISSYQPSWVLPNEWFDSIPRKFVKHTGITKRPVSREDEVALAIHATENLIRETDCDLEKCVAVVFTSPSFVPLSLARKYLAKDRAEKEQLTCAASEFVKLMGIHPRRLLTANSYCAGYGMALSLVLKAINPTVKLAPDQFVLVLTTSRISRITDYSCPQTAGLFGDLATATIISRMDSQVYPVHFQLLDSTVELQSTTRPFFQFLMRQQVLAPTIDGGKRFDAERIVFSMDGMGIADAAPRAMADAANEMVSKTGLQPENIQCIVPHQAGSAIVRLAEMKLRDAGFTCQVVNGMTRDVGNVSSGSIPYTLQQKWDELQGNILCPIASVGPPGESAVAQGCIALRSTPIHQGLST